MRVRSSLRRAHFIRIQNDLYKSFLFHIKHEENFVSSSSYDLDDEPISKRNLDSNFKFLPFQLRKMMKRSLSDSNYCKKIRCDTTTESFVASLPREFN